MDNDSTTTSSDPKNVAPVPKESLEDKRKRAALAMGGNRINERELEITSATTTPEQNKSSWLGSIVKNVTGKFNDMDLAKRRMEAKLAMEGKARRERREAEERIKQEEVEQQKAEAEKQRQLKEQETRIQEDKLAREEAAKKTAQDNATKTNIEFSKIKEAGGEISPVRTLKTDMDRYVKEQDISVAKKFVLQDQRKRAMFESGQILDGQGKKPKSHSAITIVVLFLVLMSLGVGIIYTVAKYKNIDLVGYIKGFLSSGELKPITQTANTEGAVPQFIFSEKRQSIEIENQPLKETVSEIREEVKNADIKLGSIENIVITKNNIPIIKLNEYLEAIGMEIPPVLIRLFDEKKFIYGIHSSIENGGFLVVKTKFLEKTYAEMLNWESDSLARDMLTYFSIKKPTEEIYKAPFIDEIVKNINVRVLKDYKKEVYLVYAFLDKDILIIAGNKPTFVEVLRRYNTPLPQNR